MSTSGTGKSAFARIVKEHRNTQGLSQVELAQRVKVKDSTISRWESGKNLPRTKEELLRLAEQIGYDPLQLEVVVAFEREKEAYLSGMRTASAALANSVETLIKNAVPVRAGDAKATVHTQHLENVNKCAEAVQQALQLMESIEPPNAAGEEKDGAKTKGEKKTKKKAGKKRRDGSA